MTVISLLHFNDAYRIQPQKLSPKLPETIDVTQFAQMVSDARKSWKNSSQEGLVLFSGDLFSPSVESASTRGRHMIPVMNVIAPDAAVAGNHDFDFGYLRLTELLSEVKLPWLLSNIVDETTSKVPEHLKEYEIFERGGVRIGVIGLIEQDWIEAVASWPSNFKYRPMADVGLDLSTRLRGEEKCDIVIALTHSRLHNDITLARDLLALSPEHIPSSKIASTHGVDILLGGHDHFYYASKGVKSWEGYDINKECPGSEGDKGDVLVIKSGTDFRELTLINLELEDVPRTTHGAVRRKLIKSIKGRRLETKPGMPESQELKKALKPDLDRINEGRKIPVAKTDVELDLRSVNIRTREMAASNWFADVLRHAYDDVACIKERGGADAIIFNAGALRGDSVYGPGNIIWGDIQEILPFEDSLVVLELDGDTIWTALEAGLEGWKAAEGRFPVISGFRVVWDSDPGAKQRILSIHLEPKVGKSTTGTPTHTPGAATPTQPAAVNVAHDPTKEVKREKGGKMYNIVTGDFIAKGRDGYDVLKGKKYLVEPEGGKMMSAIIKSYLLGSQFVNLKARQAEEKGLSHTFLQADTAAIVQRERQLTQQPQQPGKAYGKRAVPPAVNPIRSNNHYQDSLRVAQVEDMSEVDWFDEKMRREGGTPRTGGTKMIKRALETPLAVGMEKEKSQDEKSSLPTNEADLLLIHPVVDGRLKDIRRA